MSCASIEMNPLLHSLKESGIAQCTYAGHTQFSKYIIHKDVADLTDALEKFQFVLDQCLIRNPQRAVALTNFGWARLQGYIRMDLQDIDSTTSIFCDALALLLQLP
ncbi:hypothetical protein BDR04DRAFT_879556 [Suillus decipiens]|nr:hypothetical protein BDR04DRAFT_879556 [Suillus decipiens]